MKLKAILTLISSTLFLSACSSHSSLISDNFAGNDNSTISETLESYDTETKNAISSEVNCIGEDYVANPGDVSNTQVVPAEGSSETINNIESAEETLIFDLDTTDSEYNAIVMRIADKFQMLLNRYLPISCYLGVAESEFDLGIPLDNSGGFYEVISDKICSYQSLKNEFSDVVSDEYADFILKDNIPCYKEVDNKLYFCRSESSCIGFLDAWYLGCKFDGKNIKGYFATLLGIEAEWAQDADFVNNPSNYHYYEIVLEMIDGNWIICDIKYMYNDFSYSNTQNTYDSNGYVIHGCFYNAGIANKDIIEYKTVVPCGIQNELG
ncbi:MAG: hypothetical protein K2O14_01395 [Oscillospiraceae bacterium]|nr:hypothetical protein [Oscillospiraceae bacterium]